MESIQKMLRREYFLVALIVCVGFVFYLWILSKHSLIYGIDGPYYLIQVRSLFETGSLAYGDPPLAFFLFALFTRAVGGNMILGIKVGVALFASISAVPIHYLTKRITNLQYAGYVAMLACIFSAPHIRMMNDLLKNVVGATFLLLFVYYLHAMLFTGRNRKNLLLASFFLILTGATHILDFGVALLFLILYPALAIVFNVTGKSFAKSVGALVLILGVFVAAAFAVFPSLFTDFYRRPLSFLQDLFTAFSEGEAPILFLFDPIGGGLILPILAVGVILTFYEWKQKKKETVLVISTVTILGILLSLPFIPSEWLWRLLLMEFIPIAIILGYSASKMQPKIVLTIFLLLSFSPLALQSIALSNRMGPIINNNDYFELETMTQVVPSNSAIIVDPRIGYWVQYVTRCDIVKSRGPPDPSLWQTYDHVLALFDKPRLPPDWKPPPNSIKLFEGKSFVLFELYAPIF